MTEKLINYVKFRGERLFEGAVNIDWFNTDIEKSIKAAESFVFHGPKYHGVTQDDVGTSHGHKLKDTATFAKESIKKAYSHNDTPFTLAIAGYGTGKSHLALTLAHIFSEPSSKTTKSIIENLMNIDKEIGNEINNSLSKKPCLVLAINGMKNIDLATEITNQLITQLQKHQVDTKKLEELRPRFKQALELLKMSNDEIIKNLIDEYNFRNIEFIEKELKQHNENIYRKVHDFFSDRGISIKALGGESVEEIIKTVSREYCGENKEFHKLVILFDEFGRYTEFATTRSQIAGSGVLQNLYEGVQANSESVCFFGFIQFELNAYVQRIAPDYKNEILRYVTRYQMADKAYLSINLETIIAHLLEKQKTEKIESWFDNQRELTKSKNFIKNINNWFPQSQNHKLWSDTSEFHRIIRKGCWPLSPYSTWFLFQLTAAGKHLQERSALTLLSDIFKRNREMNISPNSRWALVPTDLWTNNLLQELISSESNSQQGSIAQSYSFVIDKYENQLTNNMIEILRGIVMTTKMGLKVEDINEAINALSEFTEIHQSEVESSIEQLKNEYNVLDWDERFKQFEILSDSVPRNEFLIFLKQKVSDKFDQTGKAELFSNKAEEWCESIKDLDSDFAEQNFITTKEWKFRADTSNVESIGVDIDFAINSWREAFEIDEPRGTIIYCYVDQHHDLEDISLNAKNRILESAKKINHKEIPIIIIFVFDENGDLGQSMAEYSVMEEDITEQDKQRFRNLLSSHKEKTLDKIQNITNDLIKKRCIITSLSDDFESNRLNRIGTELFQKIYKEPISFPFDGFYTARGNAVKTYEQLLRDAFQGKLDYDFILTKPPKDKNRAIHVLKTSWNVFKKNGQLSKSPGHPIVKKIMKEWDNQIDNNDDFNIGDKLEEICLPPYGANIASAGLLFSLFVAARKDSLAIEQDSKQYAISEWIKEKEIEIFDGKFFDINKLQKFQVNQIDTETSQEWENLINEWGEIKNYKRRIEYYKKAQELKRRKPVPTNLGIPYTKLLEDAQETKEKLIKMENKQNRAIELMEHGYVKNDVAKLSQGASDLLYLRDKMIKESEHWTDNQKKELDPHLKRGIEELNEIFPTWLQRQSPLNDSPENIGDFKHKMLHEIGSRLKELQLNDHYEKLKKYTLDLISDAEAIAEAKQLIRDVKNWIAQNQDAFRIIRVNRLRGLKKTGKEFIKDIDELMEKVEFSQLRETKKELTDFIEKVKTKEEEAINQASQIWETEIHKEKDVIELKDKIESLKLLFEGCDIDLEDLEIMDEFLTKCDQNIDSLKNEALSWSEFDKKFKGFKQEIESFEGDELPWDIEKSINSLYNEIRAIRIQKSKSWTNSIKTEVDKLSELTTIQINQLHTKASNPPPFLTTEDRKILEGMIEKIESHLNTLTIDWLIEKFQNLPEDYKKKFFEKIKKIIAESGS